MFCGSNRFKHEAEGESVADLRFMDGEISLVDFFTHFIYFVDQISI